MSRHADVCLPWRQNGYGSKNNNEEETQEEEEEEEEDGLEEEAEGEEEEDGLKGPPINPPTPSPPPDWRLGGLLMFC